MAGAAPRTRDRPDRPRLQPPGRRPARRIGSAAVLLTVLTVLTVLAACGAEAPQPQPPAEDYRARFLEARWKDLEHLDPALLVKDLSAYVHGDDPVFPPDDRRFWALHGVLFRHRPDPMPFAPLLGPRFRADEITDAVLKRDSVAMAVVTSFMRRIAEVEDEPRRRRLYDLIAYTGANFSFDPLYGDSHPATGPEVADFFMIPQIGPCEESRASLRGNLDESIALWRGRVTEKASTTFFAILLRHLGAEGADRLFSEWKGMSASERFSLVKLAGEEDRLGRPSRRALLEALLEPSMEVREAALEALQRQGAPVGELDIGVREEELRRDLKRLEGWVDETGS